MLKRVNRLKEYCEQYHQSHQRIGKKQLSFHHRKGKVLQNKIRPILTNFRICKTGRTFFVTLANAGVYTKLLATKYSAI